ncbi:MAG: Hint domain-containing protein, partial [Gemmataceae bacterium]|nr:Hint domain-containing protein [Gemmataceae bacterium]
MRGGEYRLLAVQDGLNVRAELQQRDKFGKYKRVGAGLTEQAFLDYTSKSQGADGRSAKQHIGDFLTKAGQVHAEAKRKTPPGAASAGLAPLNTKKGELKAEAIHVERDIRENACTLLSLGCFAAGTKLLTRRGWVAIEFLAEGDEVASRSDRDPSGEVAWKGVEA